MVGFRRADFCETQNCRADPMPKQHPLGSGRDRPASSDMRSDLKGLNDPDRYARQKCGPPASQARRTGVRIADGGQEGKVGGLPACVSV